MKLCINCKHYLCISESDPKNLELAKCTRPVGVSFVTGNNMPPSNNWCASERKFGDCGQVAVYFEEITNV